MRKLAITSAIFLFCAVLALAQTVEIDPQKSQITVRAFKAGLFSVLAHDHEIQAPVESGRIDLKARTVELTIDARKLKVLDPELAADKRTEVQKTMLSDQVLDSERFHEIRFHSTSATSNGGAALTVHGDLTLHGQTRPVVVEVTGTNGTYTGRAKLKQHDFGIKPVSIAGGTVKVKDEIAIEFKIVTAAQPARSALVPSSVTLH